MGVLPTLVSFRMFVLHGNRSCPSGVADACSSSPQRQATPCTPRQAANKVSEPHLSAFMAIYPTAPLHFPWAEAAVFYSSLRP